MVKLGVYGASVCPLLSVFYSREGLCDHCSVQGATLNTLYLITYLLATVIVLFTLFFFFAPCTKTTEITSADYTIIC